MATIARAVTAVSLAALAFVLTAGRASADDQNVAVAGVAQQAPASNVNMLMVYGCVVPGGPLPFECVDFVNQGSVAVTHIRFVFQYLQLGGAANGTVLGQDTYDDKGLFSPGVEIDNQGQEFNGEVNANAGAIYYNGVGITLVGTPIEVDYSDGTAWHAS